jgi:mRNA interferase MazF
MSIKPQRGEIWLVNLDPTIGAEIKKTRPVVIVSSNTLGKLPLKLVVPITDWKDSFINNLWHVKINPNSNNGLTKKSVADALQTRSIDLTRFIQKLGNLSPKKLHQINTAIVNLIEYEYENQP